MMSDVVALKDEVADSPFFGSDLAPTSIESRTWGFRDMAVLWISMSACIPTYTLASSMLDQGMDWKQAILTILVGNLIVLVPLMLNAHAGTKYGINFPIFCRGAFGLLGANIPAMLRAMVACGWFGIQAWIGGQAIYLIGCALVPSLKDVPMIGSLGINWAQAICFLAFWLLNLWIVFRGIESIRFLLNIKAPLLIFMGLAMLAWAYFAAKGLGPMFSKPSAFVEGGIREGKFWSVFFPSLTAVIGFWSTLALNIPDFSRYCRSQRDQMLGQAVGLPTTMTLFAFIGVAVTSATFVIFGKTIWDPVVVLSQFSNPIVLILAMLGLCIATLATNIAANIVGPANDFANLYPGKISFKTGAIITGVLGILMQPWKLVADPSHYMELWLTSYSSLLGAVAGILIADYHLIRKTNLVVADLYRQGGRYWYSNGFNLVAIVALIAGIAPCVPGFIGKLFPVVTVSDYWLDIYSYAWFVSFAISSILYLVGMMVFSKRDTAS
jgi:nucleobase:cation symporter-1, NCS1 family